MTTNQENNNITRVIAAVVLCIGILVGWEHFFAVRRVPEQPQPSAEQTANRPTPRTEVQSSDGGVQQETPAIENAVEGTGSLSSNPEGNQVTLEHATATAVFTDHGAALRHWRFKDPRLQELDEDKQLRPIDLVQTEARKGPWPLTIAFPDSDFDLPKNAKFELTRQSASSVTYSWQSSQVKVTKIFELDPVQPWIRFSVRVENLVDRALRQRLKLSLFARQRADQETAGFTNPYPRIPGGLCFVNGKMEFRTVAGIKGESSGCGANGCSGGGGGPLTDTGNVQWVGADYLYFLTAAVPVGDEPYTAKQRRCEIGLIAEDPSIIETMMLFGEETIPPHQAITQKFTIFVGTKDLEQLDAVVGMGGEDSKLGEAVAFGWLSFLCRPMLWLMKAFFGLVGNWGLAIVLLTLLVKSITFYWTQKSMKSMKQMQQLKPKMDALREKYANDKQRLNQEVMALYRNNKVNPLGGCLPMLIQLPIWLALYKTLGVAQELYRSGFLLWINDLTARDPYFVLPLLLGGAMYLQQVLTPQPLEAAQAKMMKYFMPAMFTVMMLWLPSGLNLYILTNTVLTILHQWHMNRNGTKADPRGSGVKDQTKPQSSGRPNKRA